MTVVFFAWAAHSNIIEKLQLDTEKMENQKLFLATFYIRFIE